MLPFAYFVSILYVLNSRDRLRTLADGSLVPNRGVGSSFGKMACSCGRTKSSQSSNTLDKVARINRQEVSGPFPPPSFPARPPETQHRSSFAFQLPSAGAFLTSDAENLKPVSFALGQVSRSKFISHHIAFQGTDFLFSPLHFGPQSSDDSNPPVVSVTYPPLAFKGADNV